jgi:hypothetical protein
MGKSQLMGCISVPVLDDVGVSFHAGIEVKAKLERGESLPEDG